MRKVLYREQVKDGYSEMDNEGYLMKYLNNEKIIKTIRNKKI